MKRLTVFIKLIVVILGFFISKNKEKNEKRKEAVQQVLQGVDSGDTSLITIGFSKLQ